MTLITKSTPDVRGRAAPTTYAAQRIADVSPSTTDQNAPYEAAYAVMVARAMQEGGYEVQWVEVTREATPDERPQSAALRARADVVDGAISVWGETGYYFGVPNTPSAGQDWGPPDDYARMRMYQVFPGVAVGHATRLAPTAGSIELGPVVTPPFWTRFVGTTATV